MGATEVTNFLTRLAVERRVSASTQNQALSAILIRAGTGGKDRRTMLPTAVQTPLAQHLERMREQHEQDLRRGAGTISTQPRYSAQSGRRSAMHGFKTGKLSHPEAFIRHTPPGRRARYPDHPGASRAPGRPKPRGPSLIGTTPGCVR